MESRYPTDSMIKEFEFLGVLDAGYQLKELGKQLEKKQRDAKREFEVSKFTRKR